MDELNHSDTVNSTDAADKQQSNATADLENLTSYVSGRVI